MKHIRRWLARQNRKDVKQQSSNDGVAIDSEKSQGEASVPLEWNAGDIFLETYEVKGILGEGGMGKVYKVHHRGWNVDLAVKTPRPEIFQLDESRASFIREAETWVNLGLHPNIVSCYYVRTMGGIPRVFAEYVEGGSLEDWIRFGRLYEGDQQTSLERILDIAIQFGWGLHYAHENGLIHQDVKPHNVMITLAGDAKVTDFGLARARSTAGEGSLSKEGQSVLVSTGGMTPAYCSPEQSVGQPLSRKTDIWSWAVSLLEMFVGAVTWFSGQDAPQAFESYLSAADKQTPEMPEKLVHLVQDCLREDPAARPESMQVVVSRLKEIYQQETQAEYPRVLTPAVALRADSLNNKALSLLDLGRLEDARQAWNVAQQIDPLHIQTIYNYGLWMWQTGQQPDDLEFIQQLESAVIANQGNWRARYLLGLVYIMQGEMESARKTLEEALQLSSGDDTVRTLLGTLKQSNTSRCVKTYAYPMPIQTVACTADMRYAVLAGGAGFESDNTVLVWDLALGKIRSRLAGHLFTVENVFITPDGERTITCDKHMIRIWSLATGRCLHTIVGNHISRPGTTVALTPDGKYLAVRSVTANSDLFFARLFDVSTGRLIQKYVGRSPYLTCLAITSDGKHILGGYTDGDVCIWETRSGKLVKVLKSAVEEIVSLAVTRDGRLIVAGNEDGSLNIWEWHSDEYLHIAEAHAKRVSQIIITPDSARALTCSEFQTKLWDLASGRILHTFALHKEYVTRIAITPDGKLGLSASTDQTVRVLDLEKGRSLHTFQHKDRIHALAVSADGQYILAAESQPHTTRTAAPYYEMYLWRLNDIGQMVTPWEISRPVETQRLLQMEQTARKLLEEAKSATAIGNNAQAIETLREVANIAGFERDAEWLKIWRQLGKAARRERLLYDRCILKIQLTSRQFAQYLACTEDGKTAFVAGIDESLQAWDLENGNHINTFEHENAGSFTGIALTADERYLVIIRGYIMLEVWDWRNNRIVCSLLVSGQQQLRLGLTPDGKTMITTMLFYERLNVWEIVYTPGSEEIRLLRSLELDLMEDKHWYGCLAISPDGQKVVAGSERGKLLMWNIATGERVDLLLKKTAGILSVIFTPDGSRLLFGREDNSLQVWRVNPVPKLERLLTGHTGGVFSLAITPDSRYAISGSADCTIRIWDLFTGECIRILPGHTSTVSAIKIVLDGWKVVSTSNDGSLRVWELDWEIGQTD